MSTITFDIREDGREYWTRYYSVELDTEDYENVDQMRDAAYDMVRDGEIEGGDKDYNDSESDEIEHVDDDYDADGCYEWQDPTAEPVKLDPESSLEW